MIVRPITVTFQLSSAEPRAWLVLSSDHREPRVIEMHQRYPYCWSASVELDPADYRCRYYCGDDRNAVYHGPAQIEGGVDAGMDTLLSVKVPKIAGTSVPAISG